MHIEHRNAHTQHWQNHTLTSSVHLHIVSLIHKITLTRPIFSPPTIHSRERMAPPLQVMGNDIRMKSQLGPVGGNDHAAKVCVRVCLGAAI